MAEILKAVIPRRLGNQKSFTFHLICSKASENKRNNTPVYNTWRPLALRSHKPCRFKSMRLSGYSMDLQCPRTSKINKRSHKNGLICHKASLLYRFCIIFYQALVNFSDNLYTRDCRTEMPNGSQSECFTR